MEKIDFKFNLSREIANEVLNRALNMILEMSDRENRAVEILQGEGGREE